MAVEVGEGLTVEHAGSDFMVDVFKSLGFEYIASNPGSSFRGLQESFITYGKNQGPEWLTCCHEESSIAIADGYFRVSGKLMMAMAHGTVGLQHAAMTVYNSFVARIPVYIVLGNALDANNRRPGVEWNHSVQDASAMVREFIKWDDTPISLTHFAESAVRAYKIAMTVPTAPVILVADGDLQEEAAENRSELRIPKLTLTSPPAGDPTAVAEAARMLVAAENPVILAGRVARTEQGMALMIELAETLQAPVQGGGRDMPNRHPLSGGGSVANADVILALQQDNLWGATNAFRDQQERSYRPRTRPGVRIISISSKDLYTKSNYQDFQRYAEVDMAIAADAEATLPSLIEACKRLITGDRRRVFEERGARIAAANARALERAAHGSDLRVERQPDQYRPDVDGAVERGQEQGLGPGSGSQRSPVEHRQVLSDDRRPAARPPSARAYPPPWAPRSRTGRSAGCRSRFRMTAISCMPLAPCGPPHITGFRYCSSCTTTAPTTRR